jgi:hypothetical protein
MQIIERNQAENCFKTLRRKLIEKRNAINNSIEELNEYSEDSVIPIDSSKYIQIAKKALNLILDEKFSVEE